MNFIPQWIPPIPHPAGVEYWPDLKWSYLLTINACYIYLNFCLCVVDTLDFFYRIPFEDENLAIAYFFIFLSTFAAFIVLFIEAVIQIVFKTNQSFFKKQLVFCRMLVAAMHVINLTSAFFLDKIDAQVTYVDKTLLLCSIFGILLQIFEYCHYNIYGKEHQLSCIILLYKKLWRSESNEEQENTFEQEMASNSHNVAETTLQNRCVKINRTGGRAIEDIKVTICNSGIASPRTGNNQKYKVSGYVSTDDEVTSSLYSSTREMPRNLSLCGIESDQRTNTIDSIRPEMERSWLSFDNLARQSFSDSSNLEAERDSREVLKTDNERQTLDENSANIVSKLPMENKDRHLKTEKILSYKKNISFYETENSSLDKFRAPSTFSNEDTDAKLCDEKTISKTRSDKASSLVKSWRTLDNLTRQNLSDSSDLQSERDSREVLETDDERQSLDENSANIVSKLPMENKDRHLKTENILSFKNNTSYYETENSSLDKFRAPSTPSNEDIDAILSDEKTISKSHSDKALLLVKSSFRKKQEEVSSIMNSLKGSLIARKKEKLSEVNVPPKYNKKCSELENSSNITDNTSNF